MFHKLTTFKEKISPGLWKIASNTVWLMLERIFQMGLSLLIGFRWVALYLKPEQYGLLNYSIAFAGILGPIAKMGLDSIVVRDITRDATCKEETLGSAFGIKLVASIFTSILTIILVSYFQPKDYLTIALVGILTLQSIFQASDVIDFWFQSEVRSKYVVWARNFAFLLSNMIKIVLILIKAPLIYFAWGLLAESALIALGMAIVYRWQGNSFRGWRFNWPRAQKLVLDSWPLILSGLVITIYMRIDQIMIGQMIGDREVGIYSAAVKISEMWYFVPIAILNSVFPAIVKAREKSREIYYERTQQMFDLMVLLSYSVSIPIAFFARNIVDLILKSNETNAYAASADILIIHIWTGLFVSIGVARGFWLIAEGLTTFTAVSSAIGAAVNLILNLYFIKVYGGLGAAFATLIAQFVASYAAHLLYQPTRIIFVMQTRAIFLIDPIRILIKKLTKKADMEN